MPASIAAGPATGALSGADESAPLAVLSRSRPVSAELLTSARSAFHARASCWSTSTKPGLPHRDVGGKYVPPKNGLRSGVSQTLIGHPPAPVVACTNIM